MVVNLTSVLIFFQVLEERLKKELEEWKVKARKLRSEWDSLKAKYSQVLLVILIVSK
jgi:hypothetical protein